MKSISFCVHPALVVCLFATFSTTCPVLARQSNEQIELAELDAAATMMGSIQSWINGETEAAIHAFQQREEIQAYLEGKSKEHQAVTRGRIADRMSQIKSGLRHWNDVVPRFQTKMPQQIASELKRQRTAVERYRKAKTPRPSSFAYVPKSAWATKDKLDMLAASGYDTTKLEDELKEVHSLVLELASEIPVAALAKSRRICSRCLPPGRSSTDRAVCPQGLGQNKIQTRQSTALSCPSNHGPTRMERVGTRLQDA